MRPKHPAVKGAISLLRGSAGKWHGDKQQMAADQSWTTANALSVLLADEDGRAGESAKD
jgi:hypothetical protein